MLSILIPTYNYDAFPLVESLFNQCEKAGIEYEIIVFDDGSENQFNNEKINSLKNCSFKVLEKNMGRSSIRNLLAKTAKFEWLLFLDADAFLIDDKLIFNYIKDLDFFDKVLCGGMRYQPQKPLGNKLLRWVYGKKREALTALERQKNEHLSFFTINFLIHKSVFKQVGFNEKLLFYGYEDVLFSYELKQKKIPIKHIDNPVYHIDQSTSEEFLQKSKTALQTLYFLIENKRIEPDKIKIAKVYVTLKKYRLTFLLRIFYKFFEKPVRNQLLGTNPNLKLFDLYRLGYLCSIKD